MDRVQEWTASRNSHDIDSIMSHYSEDVVFTSPFVIKLLGDETGTIEGKDRLRHYFEKGLGAYPDLNFELIRVLSGVNSITLYYRSVKEILAAEIMVFNRDGKISKVLAHYSED